MHDHKWICKAHLDYSKSVLGHVQTGFMLQREPFWSQALLYYEILV